LAFSKNNTPAKKLGTFDENIKLPSSAGIESSRSGAYNEAEPVYMFGKYNGAPWVKKPTPSKNLNILSLF
jgi:hypothetical protein